MVLINFGDEINYETIFNNLIDGKKPRDPVSTKNVKIKIILQDSTFGSNFMFELDSSCQNIINEILSAQLNSVVECVKISENNFIYLKKNFSAIELKKLKQEYIKVSKLHPPKNKDEMIKTFVEYINTVQDRY